MGDMPSYSHCQWELSRIPPSGMSPRQFVPMNVTLKKGVTSCGRALNNTIRCVSVLSSRIHCSFILKNDGSVFIKDHKSLNGTFLNGTKILKEREIALDDGDIIGIGVELEFNGEPPPEQRFIFKIRRKLLCEESLTTCDQDTVVPIRPEFSFELNGPRLVCNPSTSNCRNQGIQTVDLCLPNNSKSSQGAEIPNEIVDVVDSSDEENDKTDTNTPQPMLDDEPKLTTDNIITIDSDTDTPVLVSTKEIQENYGHPKRSPKTDGKHDKNSKNNNIKHEDLLDSKEVESSEKKTIDKTSHVNDVNGNEECIQVDVQSALPLNFDSISLSSSTSAGSGEKESNKLASEGCKNKNIQENIPLQNYGKSSKKSHDVESIEDQQDKNCEGTFSLNIKEEICQSNSVDDGIIYIEDDDEGELPCSQLFDINCDTNEEVEDQVFDVDNMTSTNVDCWYADDEAVNYDSDSDAEQWFQRLSQSVQNPSDDEGKDNKEVADSKREDVAFPDKSRDETKEREEYIPVDEEENDDSSRDSCAENEFPKTLRVTDIEESEPIVRNIPSGGKRKLSISSEEDFEEDINKQIEDIYDESESSSSETHLSTSKTKCAKFSDKKEILKGNSFHKVSDKSVCSLSPKRKKPKVDRLKEKYLHTKHKKTKPSLQSDESRSSSVDIPNTSINSVLKNKNKRKSSTSCNGENLVTEDTSDDCPKHELLSGITNEINIFIGIKRNKQKMLKESEKPNKSVEETSKLHELSKKVSASHTHKSVKIIEAKPIKPNKRSIIAESETVNKKDDKTNEKKHDQWYSNSKTSQNVVQIQNKSDARKEYRKQRLKHIAMKEAQDNQQQDKPKVCFSKNKTKTTVESRSDRLLQDLVSSDGANEKLKKGTSLASYKIPRRPSKTEDSTGATAFAAVTTKQSDEIFNSKPKPLCTEISPHPFQVENSAEKTTNQSTIIDQILKSGDGKLGVNSLRLGEFQSKPPAFGVENEEPNTIITLNEQEYKIKFPYSGCHLPSKRKSLLKESTNNLIKSTTLKEKVIKKVKFNFPNDNKNLTYVGVRVFDAEECLNRNPVTERGRKEFDMKGYNPRRSEEYTSYWEETIYAICKWNCSWFEEKGNSIKDPPAFEGQTYHLNEDFVDYSDYRRGYYPLLMYELWGTICKHYEQIILKQKDHNRIPFYYVDIKHSVYREVANNFFPSVKKEVLLHLKCQVLLDKKRQNVWPRVGDFVMLSLTFKPSEPRKINGKIKHIKGGEKRVLGYISEVPKPTNFHAEVSPKLREKHQSANLVVDGFTILLNGNRGQEIDRTILPRVVILKNINPELRVFEALDRLPSSPLCKLVFQAKNNFTNENNFSDQSSKPLAEYLNPLQEKAVMNIARECVKNNNMIRLVHGPPGCGKSEVISNIILQMWYNWHSSNKFSGSFQQIILCAPSNSAIDELVVKLVRRRDELFKGKDIPKFNLIRVGVEQNTHVSCSHLTLDYLTRMELKRLTDVKEDDNQIRIEIQVLEAKKHQLSQKLESLIIHTRKLDAQPSIPGENKKELMVEKIKQTEKKLAETKARISYFESGKEPNEREKAIKHKEIQLELLQKADIIATTLSSCYNGIMSEAYKKRFIKFDCCIVDEATQCTEPDILIPLMLGVKKLVLVGDPKQLPATVVTTTAKSHGLEKSLFARHYDWWEKKKKYNNMQVNPCHFLNEQYRMHPDIAQWPSMYFYGPANGLVSPDWLKNRRPTFPLVPYAVLSHEFNQNTKEGECNEEEAKLVCNIIYAIVKHELSQNFKIGVITPYNRQKDELKRRINMREFPNIEIGTVDSFQGRESDIVIFSCVRTEGVGFLGGQERLNVALTRAKHSLIIVGNFTSLQRDSTWNSLLTNAKDRNVIKTVVNKNAIAHLIFNTI